MIQDDSKFDPSSGFKNYKSDADVEELVQIHCETYNIRAGEAARLFPVLLRRQHLKRFLAHSELFKMTREVPGDIAELGVYRGLGLMTWANLLESYCVGDRTKTVFGFDNWKGFAQLSKQDGGEKALSGKEVGGFSPSAFKEELESAIRIFDGDRFIPWKPRIKLVEGDIGETIPRFADENPGVRFSLIHFDCDLYKPTKIAIEKLWPRLSRGGIMIFDEYSIHDWPGETMAVDEFLSDKPHVQLRKFDWTNSPAAWLVKP